MFIQGIERNLRHDPGVFVTTHWSIVLAAGGDSSTNAREALSELCSTYWYPLYAFVRRQGHSPHDAEDLTQTFFASLLEKHTLGQVEKGKGRFRSFLLACLTNFLTNEWDKQRRLKRGGDRIILSLNQDSAEERYLQEPSHDVTPERLYERSWALTMIQKSMTRLSEQYSAAGKRELFRLLQDQLIGEEADSYAHLAEQLGMKEGSVRMAMLRMRRHFGFLLREEVAQTVSDPTEIEAELRHLVTAAAG